MKTMNKYIALFFFLSAALTWSCTEEDASLNAPTIPGVVDMGVSIAPDSSGVVTFAPTASGAFNFHLYPGDGAGPILIASGESYDYIYAGLDSVEFAASMVAYGVGAGASSASELIEMFIKLQIAPETMIALTGAELNSSKRWVWDAAAGGINGHFGVGPGPDFPNPCCVFDGTPSFFAADANNFAGGCLYDDVLTFSVNEQGVPSFLLETNGETFINAGQVDILLPGNGDGNDQCGAVDDQLVLSSSWAVRPVEGELDLLVFGGAVATPMSYYSDVPEYQVMELTPNKLRVMGFTSNRELVWFHQFIPE